AGVPGVPSLRGEFETDWLRAFALDFCPGESPSLDAEFAPYDLLTAWIQPQRKVSLIQLPALRRLQELVTTKPELVALWKNLAEVEVHPAIVHGDFAPWNIKVAPRDGSWLVLDWERGERDGVPGWDWFHFVIQPELLVKRRKPEAIAQKLLTFLTSQPFQTYAAAAKIVGHERGLLCAYLAYFTQVVRPSEGCEAAEELLRCLLR
ncbi:MAG: phosphotransferase, partial [Verrucomicrobiota bacterium]